MNKHLGLLYLTTAPTQLTRLINNNTVGGEKNAEDLQIVMSRQGMVVIMSEKKTSLTQYRHKMRSGDLHTCLKMVPQMVVSRC